MIGQSECCFPGLLDEKWVKYCPNETEQQNDIMALLWQ